MTLSRLHRRLLAFLYAFFLLTVVSGETVEKNESKEDDSYFQRAQDLMEWIRDHGGKIDKRQEIRKQQDENDSSNKFGVYATEFIPEGTILCQIPYNLVIAPDDPESDDPCDTIQALKRELLLLKQGESKFAPHLRMMEALQQQHRKPIMAWSQAGQDLLSVMLGDNLPPQGWNKPLEWWEFACGGNAENDPIGKQALFQTVGDPTPNFLTFQKKFQTGLMPFYSLYNHRFVWQNTVVAKSFVGQDILIVAHPNDIKKGEQIYVNYGIDKALGTSNLFRSYGFVEPLPQRFSFRLPDNITQQSHKVDFDINTSRRGGKMTVKWVDGHPPTARAVELLQQEIDRLEVLSDFADPDMAYLASIPQDEKEVIWEYISALFVAMFHATKASLTWPVNTWTLYDYEVNGVNLAQFKLSVGEQEKVETEHQPFELFDDFDIADLIHGNEGWQDLLDYRNVLERPSLSFYVDKVARKRWLPTVGISQPACYALRYASELTETGQVDDETEAILQLLPNTNDFVAKPSHFSETVGVWLVSHNESTNTTIFSSKGRHLEKDTDNAFDRRHVASSLATNLHAEARDYESWALKNVKPGVVMEERYVEIDKFDKPPIEFNTFTIWGRVYAAQLKYITSERIRRGGWIYRNGTFAQGGEFTEMPFDYVDWSRIVSIAEQLGANKDMFRTDVFVGVSATSFSSLQKGTEREAALEYLVSECEFYPTTVFDNDLIAEEAARLWIAGYKIGNYKTVPNTEVPKEFLETGTLPEGCAAQRA